MTKTHWDDILGLHSLNDKITQEEVLFDMNAQNCYVTLTFVCNIKDIYQINKRIHCILIYQN